MFLTEEQKFVIKNVVKDIGSNQIVTCGGVAGTGKSTILKVIKQALKNKGLNFLSCAFTGKATNVLTKKGIPSCTIHKAIYQPIKDEKDNVYWIKKDRYHPDILAIDGFTIDEASTVSLEIHKDLISYGLPIIYIGDHGQLEPVGTDFNLMKNPMYKLEEIHRNAGEIAYFAHHLRKGNPAVTFKADKQVQIVKSTAITDRHLASVDQIICAFNKTRVQINQKIREYKNIQYTYLSEGEKIICLKNNTREALFNGMQGIVTELIGEDRFSFISDGELYQNIQFDCEQFGKETNQFKHGQEANPFDYGYSISCHKSQGSEFDKGIVIEQPCDKWSVTRWNYTAASRFKKGLIWQAAERYIPKYLG